MMEVNQRKSIDMKFERSHTLTDIVDLNSWDAWLAGKRIVHGMETKSTHVTFKDIKTTFYQHLSTCYSLARYVQTHLNDSVCIDKMLLYEPSAATPTITRYTGRIQNEILLV